MKIIEKVIFIAGSIVGIAIMINLSTFFFQLSFSKNINLEGGKEYILEMIKKCVEKCFENYLGKRKSVLCYTLNIKSEESILADEIVNIIERAKIEVKIEKIKEEDKILIRYENGKIFIDRMSYERIES